MVETDFLIIGSGIIGLSLGRELLKKFPSKKIIILEKERDIALHASGRNSGVLHAGFYYSADSLKARFAKNGCREMKDFCRKEGLRLNECGKIVIAKDETELETLHDLEKRGRKNNVEVSLIGEKEAAEIEPNAKVFRQALYSPTTATIDPLSVSNRIKEILQRTGVTLLFGEAYSERLDINTISTSKGTKIHYDHLFNCSGLYADKIAHDFEFGANYTLIPFKGIYLEYTKEDKPVRTNVYPVPYRKNPFLGVHFTVTVDGSVKIGPTAIPALWRENYSGVSNFSAGEMLNTLRYQTELFITNAFSFRDLAFEEIKKYYRPHFVKLASGLLKKMNSAGFNKWSIPGIRAQLIDKRELKIVMDFIVEGDKSSTHVLNAVSPAFTCSLPFSRWLIDRYSDINLT